jgi:hypothetical protein
LMDEQDTSEAGGEEDVAQVSEVSSEPTETTPIA